MGFGAAIGGIIGAVGSIGSSALKGSGGSAAPKTWNINNYDKLQLGDVEQSFGDFTGQQKYATQLNNFNNYINNLDNTSWQQEVEKLDPSALDTVLNIGRNANQLSKGIIPTDVSDQVTRSAAYKALSGGYGGSGMANALTARDLGLTSLNLESEGANLAGTNMNLINSLNPSKMLLSQELFSPSQILARQDQEQEYNTDVGNQVIFANAGRNFSAQQLNAQRGMLNANNWANAPQAALSAGLQGYNAFKSIFNQGNSNSGSGGDFTLNSSDYSGGGGETVGDLQASLDNANASEGSAFSAYA